MSYFQKTLSGAQDGKLNNISINNTSRKLPIDINGSQLGLQHILKKQTILSDSESAY
jgi:hypothetical protein